MADDTLLYITCPHNLGRTRRTAHDTTARGGRAFALIGRADELVYVIVLDGHTILANVMIQADCLWMHDSY